MGVPKQLRELINNTYNRIKFDTIGDLCRTIGINKKQLKNLKRYKVIKIRGCYLYVNPKKYKGYPFISKSVYELFSIRQE